MRFDSIDRRHVLRAGLAAGSSLALGAISTRRSLAQDEAPLAVDASDLEALIAAAQQENRVDSYGAPDEWANFGEIWAAFGEKYGIIEHLDTDLDSAQTVAKFLAEKDNPISDIGAIGILFAPTAIQLGVAAPFKVEGWDEIPDWAKDPDGRWVAQYSGTIGFWVNTDLVDPVPRTWQDLLQPDYRNMVTMFDPRQAATGNFAVIAAAFATGGNERDVAPGIAFFQALNAAGNLKATSPTLANVQTGEAAIVCAWDFVGLGYKVALEGQAPLEIVIPEDGTVIGADVSVINTFAPHPNAARLARNFMLSPEGQTIFATGFATPVRPSVEIPAEVKAVRPPDEAYAAARTVSDWAAATASAQHIAQVWGSEVLGQ